MQVLRQQRLDRVGECLAVQPSVVYLHPQMSAEKRAVQRLRVSLVLRFGTADRHRIIPQQHVSHIKNNVANHGLILQEYFDGLAGLRQRIGLHI